MEGTTVLFKQKEMNKYEEFKLESVTRLIEGLADIDVYLSEGQIDVFKDLVNSELDKANVQSAISGLTISEAKFRLVNTPRGIVGWHPVDGKWVHITQTNKDGKMYYYTNGVRQKIE